MNQSIESKKTIRLVSNIALLKESELRQYQNKMLELKEQVEQDSNNTLKKHKYNVVQTRFVQLKSTFKSLKQLEFQLHK
ncbi:hypothetical protein [Winogradskyella vidalii]|uniref:hypothetical protein n=1 Tax=Winogradskyella vidalii TaxID=2615024 RepID=UPI0015CCEBAC|nr:hypothetical protein [Winogradskyella vidalii]